MDIAARPAAAALGCGGVCAQRIVARDHPDHIGPCHRAPRADQDDAHAPWRLSLLRLVCFCVIFALQGQRLRLRLLFSYSGRL